MSNVLSDLNFSLDPQSSQNLDYPLSPASHPGTSSGLPVHPILQVIGVRFGNLDIIEPSNVFDADEDMLDKMDDSQSIARQLDKLKKKNAAALLDNKEKQERELAKQSELAKRADRQRKEFAYKLFSVRPYMSGFRR